MFSSKVLNGQPATLRIRLKQYFCGVKWISSDGLGRGSFPHRHGGKSRISSVHGRNKPSRDTDLSQAHFGAQFFNYKDHKRAAGTFYLDSSQHVLFLDAC